LPQNQRTLINEQASCTHEQARMRMSPLAGRPLKNLKKTPKFAPKIKTKKRMGHQEDIAKTESKIIVIRDTQVILDRDVAELYGVETKAINQAVKRNIEKFPPEYMFQLSKEEKQEVVTKCDHLGNLRYSRTLPNAFTEQGLYMLATILKSPIATETTFAIIDTFTKLRKLARTMAKLNDEAEQGIVPDEAEQGKLQGMMNEVFADKLPLKMRKFAFSINLGIAKLSFETTRERKD
jgi:soluble cytochrome b562